MINFLYSLRYISLIAVICSFLGSVLAFCVGGLKTFKAFSVFFLKTIPDEKYLKVNPVDLSTKYLVLAVDAFLFGLVLLVFAFGIFNLFIKKIETDVSWLHIDSIGHLKNALAQLIVVILYVKFLEIILLNIDDLSWQILVLPISIFLLSVALKFLNLKE